MCVFVCVCVAGGRWAEVGGSSGGADAPLSTMRCSVRESHVLDWRRAASPSSSLGAGAAIALGGAGPGANRTSSPFLVLEEGGVVLSSSLLEATLRSGGQMLLGGMGLGCGAAHLLCAAPLPAAAGCPSGGGRCAQRCWVMGSPGGVGGGTLRQLSFQVTPYHRVGSQLGGSQPQAWLA